MKGRRSPLELKDFSGGQITKTPPKNIDTKYSVDCLNVHNEGLMLRRRAGITVVNPTAVSGVGYGLYDWMRGSAATAQWLMSVWGASVYQMSVATTGLWSGTWNAITAHSASGTSFTTAGGISYFCNFNGVLIISNDGREHVQRMTVADGSYFNVETAGAGTAPLAKFVVNWNNHAWYMNCVGSEDQVVNTDVFTYNDFTGDLAGTNTILSENDIGITGWFILGKSLYPMKAFSIHRITYTGSPSPLVSIHTFKATVGTRSPRTVKRVNVPDGEVVLFLGSSKKLYLCDGASVQDISDGMDITNGLTSVYMQAINEKALNACFAVIHEDLNWYELFVCIGTATSPNYSIVYDYLQKSFWPMSNRNFTYGNLVDNGSQKRVVFVQGTDGKAHMLNSGNDDEGVAIDSYWTSEKIGPSIILDKFDEIEVETAAVVCTPTFSWRADWESSWVAQTMKTNTNSNNWSPSRIDNLIQFKIADNSLNPTFKLWTILGSQRAIGGGK